MAKRQPIIAVPSLFVYWVTKRNYSGRVYPAMFAFFTWAFFTLGSHKIGAIKGWEVPFPGHPEVLKYRQDVM